MADLTKIEEFESQVTATNVNLVVTLDRASKVGFIGFSRASAQSITSIVISITRNGAVFKLIELLATTVKEVSITDEITLPRGAIVTVVTAGVTTGAVNAFVSLEAIIV